MHKTVFERVWQFTLPQIATIGATSKQLSEGEYESLKAISGTFSDFVPVPYAWGTCETYGKDACFLLEEFRELSKQVSRKEVLS